ncbi:MAG: PEPxxWA-CTERM sorting domain-containing protein [Sphingomonadaceae bacterium]|nr:PEPxxWA-CTERM sorting domain-containing protein [Sphingomonadaceae bacterium]MDW8414416.1 PEPxxWA-CTERM sorting domain-containing protein [Thermaurantiacus sp.]
MVNWVDEFYDSGLAWRDLTIGDTPINPIPEPAAWALMIAGFGLVGMAARRRRLAVAA